MKQYILKIASLCFLANFILISNALSDNIHIKALSYVFAPLQIAETEENPGYAIEIVRELMARVTKSQADITSEFKILPFKRAYAISEMEPNVLFYSISRTEARESNFYWIGEISPYKLYFFKLKKNTNLNPTSFQDILDSDTMIAVADNSNMEKLLLNKGFLPNVNFMTYPHYHNGIKMLFHDRFSMLPLTSFLAKRNTCQLGFNGDDIESVFKINSLSNPLWLTLSKSTSIELVNLLKKLYADLIEEGYVENIQNKYLDVWNSGEC